MEMMRSEYQEATCGLSSIVVCVNKPPKDCMTENNKDHLSHSQVCKLGRASGRRLISPPGGSLAGAGGCASKMAHSRGCRLVLGMSCEFSSLESSPHGPCHLACTSVPRKRVGWNVAFYDPTSEITLRLFQGGLFVEGLTKGWRMDSTR